MIKWRVQNNTTSLYDLFQKSIFQRIVLSVRQCLWYPKYVCFFDWNCELRCKYYDVTCGKETCLVLEIFFVLVFQSFLSPHYSPRTPSLYVVENLHALKIDLDEKIFLCFMFYRFTLNFLTDCVSLCNDEYLSCLRCHEADCGENFNIIIFSQSV